MVSQRSRSLLLVTLVVVVGIAAEWTWSRTRNASLVERMLWGAIVLVIVYSQRVRVWLVEILDSKFVHQSDFSVEDRWFGRALQVWLFPLGLALIAEPLAQSDSVRYPAGVALAVMFIALLAWSVFILERQAPASDAHRTCVWWQFVPRRPTITMLAGFVVGALVIAGPLYISGTLHGAEWIRGNWASVVVGAFMGGFLALTRWLAVTYGRSSLVVTSHDA